MKKFFLALLVLSVLHSRSQNDSTKKNYLSVDLFQLAANFEAGLYYEHNLSKKYSFVASYGHRFNDFGIEWSDTYTWFSPPIANYQARQTDVIKAGIKRYHLAGKERTDQYKYLQLSVAYKYSYTKAHWQVPRYFYHGGDERNFFSAYEHMFGISFSYGREKHFKNGTFLGVDLNPSLYFGNRTEHVWLQSWTEYAWDYSLSPPAYVGSRKSQYGGIIERWIIRPTITVSIKLGFGW